MKNFIYTLAILCLTTTQLVAQNAEVIQDEVRTTSYENKSYLVVKSLTIKPPLNGEFRVSAATHGSFYIKMADAANIKANIPPSLNQNFIREENILVAGVVNENQIANLSKDGRSTTYKYIDGMGREFVKVGQQASPSGKDLVQGSYFDGMGNKTKEYLPYVTSGTTGAYTGDYYNGSKTFFTSSTPLIAFEDEYTYSETIYENSSLNRVTEKYGPGRAWRTAHRKQQSNVRVDASGTVIRWIYENDNTPPTLGTYDTLLINESIDEENRAKREFVDKRGHVILVQQQASGDYLTNPGAVSWLETYNIYDDLGRLKIVIPPEAVSRIASEYITNATVKENFLRRWCFRYRHDDRWNVIEKWSPGWTDWEYTVYDQWNRKVLTQTPSQRERNEWTFYKYDQLNREIITGLWTTTTDVATIRGQAFAASTRFETSNITSPEGYSITSTYPTSISVSNIVSFKYYDNYNFLQCVNWDEISNSNFSPIDISGFAGSSTFLTSPTGHETGKKVRVLNTSTWLNSVVRYDGNFNTVQSVMDNYLGGREVNSVQYNFSGKVLKTRNAHSSSVSSLTVLREYVYDHTNALVKLYQTTDNGPRVLLAENKYNELGHLIEKNVHSVDDGATFLQSVDKRQNIRGWLTSVNNSSLDNDGSLNNDATDLFGMQLYYNNPSITVGSGADQYSPVGLYNNNISAITWKVDTKSGATPEERAYAYEYDQLRRLTKAYYGKKNSGTWTGDPGMFNEALKYDKNGNILGIQRYGKINDAKTVIDSTYYKYKYYGSTISNYLGESNRLLKVKDAGNSYGFKDALAQQNEEFVYDASGNLIFDNNKEISNITYNYLNLPVKIEFTRGDGSIDRIIYSYDASGVKVRTSVFKNGTTLNNGTQVWQTDYTGEVQYDKDGSAAGQLTFASTPEGRVVKNGSGYDYQYFYRDHQGTIRVTYGAMKETVSYRATMENPVGSSIPNEEEATFYNIANRRYPNSSYNYTKPYQRTLAPDKSAKTNPSEGSVLGPAKRLRVLQGDKISMEVFAKYTASTGSTSTILPSALLSALAGSSTFNLVENAYSSFQNNLANVAGAGTSSTTIPKAYIAYVFLTDAFAYGGGAATSVTTAAFNSFEKLARTFTAPQDGYLYVYVANESNTATSTVYFDEMLIVHQKNAVSLQVAQASDYYPFGLAFNTYQAERIKEDYSPQQQNRYGFQGQELQKDLDLGWSQFKYRMHDAALGRFISVDPLSDKYAYNSPFAFQENKLGAGVELEGKELYDYYLGVRLGMFLWDISPAGMYQRTGQAMMNSASQTYSSATRGEQHQQQGMTGNYNFHKIEAANKVAKLRADSELLKVGMEWTSFSLMGAIGALENIGSNLAVRMMGARTITSKSPIKKLSGGAVEEAAESGSSKSAVTESAAASAPKAAGKTISELGLKDGMKVSSREALELGEEFLGPSYTEPVPGSGRFVSADGTRVFRMGESDITGAHGGGPHVNFETLVPNPAKPGKMKVDQNIHVYLTD